MPLLGNEGYRDPSIAERLSDTKESASRLASPARRQSQHSTVAKTAILSHFSTPSTDGARTPHDQEDSKEDKVTNANVANFIESVSRNGAKNTVGNGRALSDTPATTPSTTAPNSPIIVALRKESGSSTPARHRPATTLDIPGLTKSRVSPDGRIAQRDVGSKLIIVMCGLPARGKSYITKKIARYLNWLQHDTRIFNVGERRRVVAGGPLNIDHMRPKHAPQSPSINAATAALNSMLNQQDMLTPPTSPSTRILVNGEDPPDTPPLEKLPPSAMDLCEDEDILGLKHDEPRGNNLLVEAASTPSDRPAIQRVESMEQTASFFDPTNEKASHIREQVAMETLDELLDYILDQGGSVGIFDATNSTLERRKAVSEKVRQRAGPDLGVLFLESLCLDESLLESNMRLKLSGPDYRDQDPVVALKDFKKRIDMYQRNYVALGEFEEKNNMPYIQMIDVGRKVVSHQIKGFLSAQVVFYLLNFNLAPRQIWITRHGESLDNLKGKIGGDSELSEVGQAYAKALTRFMKHERQVWEVHQRDKALSTHFPPQPGDTTPPNPEYHGDQNDTSKNFCVWTSMLKRSIQTAQHFDEEEFDVKQMKMLDELNAGAMEGLTYEEIKTRHASEYELRKRDKLHYRYPGAGGEGYLDIINRLRAVIVEVERTTDHVLLVGHRSIARVLLAYFMGLKREDVAQLDVPLGMLYMLEPKPYGVEFKAYRYDAEADWFYHVPYYELKPTDHVSAY